MNFVEAVFDFLQIQYVNVFLAGTITGEVVENTTVVKLAEETRFAQFSSKQRYIDILCYVPKNQYNMIGVYSEQIAEKLKSCVFIRDAHSKTAPYFDESYNAWMVSMLYYNVRKI